MSAVALLAASAFAAVPYAAAAAFSLFAVGMVLHARRERRWVAGLAQRGVDADARVERLKAHAAAGSTSRDGAQRRRYRAVVSFRDAAGEELVATTRWPSSVAPRVGDRLRVRYDLDRPRRVVVAEGPGSAAPPTWASYALAVVGVVFAWVALSVGRTIG